MNANLHKKVYAKIPVFCVIIFSLILSLVGTTGFASSTDQSLASYIIQGTNLSVAENAVQKYGGQVTSRLEIIESVTALLPEKTIGQLTRESGIVRITPNAKVELVGWDGGEQPGGNQPGGAGVTGKADRDGNIPDTDYPEVIGVNLAWEKGVTGKGITVAVVDTGIAPMQGLDHPGERGKGSRIIGWVDFVQGKPQPHDPNGHGTHVAGIIANDQVGPDRHPNGIAPDVMLAGVRVLDANGVGTYENVIQGIQWVIKNKKQLNIRVINLSLVSPVKSPYWADPFNRAVMRAWAEGIVVIVAAGNTGSKPMSITVPGNNPYAVTVGAFTDNYTPLDWNDDYITPFSSAGPTLDGFVKPDLVAPGAHMVSLMLPGSVLARSHEANKVTSTYFSMAGTSQAAAVTSGVAALILSKNPALTPDQVKYRLVSTSLPWVKPDRSDVVYSMWQQGAGRINAPDAILDKSSARANLGLNVEADLNGSVHYEGYSYYDPDKGAFRLHAPYDIFNGAYGTWAGAYGTWAGAYGTWAGVYGTWAGAYGTWAGAYGTWAGAYGTWAGAYGTWAGAYGTWAGAYGTWAGGYQSWSEADTAWAGIYGQKLFVDQFVNWTSKGAYGTWAGSNDFIGVWVEDHH
ncbi:MAG TPA: S8 family serine peptidase [Anaerolineaceae bacterium]